MKAAATRACDAYGSVRRAANKLAEEMDEVTASHGIPITELDVEDSAVIVVAQAIAANSKAG
jgi:hypothetical protein